MNRRTFIASTVGTVGIAVAGCLGDSGDQAPSEVEVVRMLDDEFDPIRLQLPVGAGVRWVNESSSSITLTSSRYSDDAQSWSLSESVAPDQESSTITFSEAGIYHYHDVIKTRDQMCGAIVVGEVSDEAPLPCE